MKKINNKKEELFTQMIHFVNNKDKKIYFSEWFMQRVKNMASDEFSFYSNITSHLKDYEVIVVKSKALQIY